MPTQKKRWIVWATGCAIAIAGLVAWAVQSPPILSTNKPAVPEKAVTQASHPPTPTPAEQQPSAVSTPKEQPPASTPDAQKSGPIHVVNLSQVLPGMGNDAENYRETLRSSSVADAFNTTQQNYRTRIDSALKSGNPLQAQLLHLDLHSWEQRKRQKALDQAKKAAAAGNWQLAVRKYKERIAYGDDDHALLWWNLAQAMQRDHEKNDKHLAYVAYLAYRFNIQSNRPQVSLLLPSLLILQQSLAEQGNFLSDIHLLQAMYRAYPHHGQIRQELHQAIVQHGFRVQSIRSDVNQFPTRTCVRFTADLSNAPDFHASTWVSFTPARPQVAVVRNDGGICIQGLPAGRSTQMHIRAGLPAIAGAVLSQAKTLTLRLSSRSPSIISDTGRFIIPASLPATVGFSSVNISRVKIKVNRVPERALLAFMSNHPLLRQDSMQRTVDNQNSLTVWKGTANIPHFQTNRLLHTLLPLPKILRKPGLYAIQIGPGDGTPNASDSLDTVQLVLRTNLAPTVWRGRNGLYVQVRRYTNAAPWSGVKVDLIAQDNDVLQRAQTNGDGIAFFPHPILQGQGGQAPAALHIHGPHGEFTLFDLAGSPLNLSGRGISGRPALKPVSPFLWLDRGIYRPGETVHVSALYRGAAGQALDLPLHLIVRRPGGQVFLDTVPARRDDDAIAVPVKLPAAAQDGNWSVSLAMGRHEAALAKTTFTVSAFVPPTLAVDLGHPKPIPAGKITQWPVQVRYLYGAPGAHLTGNARIRLLAGPAPYPQWQSYHFGLHGEMLTAPVQEPAFPETNAKGSTETPLNLTHLPDSTRFLQAQLLVTVNEPSGRPVSSKLRLPILPDHPLIGIKDGFANQTVANGKAPAFQLVAVNPDGKADHMPVQVQVVRQSPEWSITMHHGVASWGYSYIDHPILQKTITLPAGEPYNLRLPILEYGRYRLRVVEAHRGLAASSVIFYSGWQTSANPGVPQRVSVRSNTQNYAAGSVAKIHISAPFAGPAVLVIANDKILQMRNFTLPKTGTTLSVRVNGSWGAGAYAMIDVFRPATANTAPQRAIGMTWLGVTPGARAIPVHFGVHPIYRPQQDIDIPIQTRPGAYVTLAAVDQGILNLTQFPNPNPLRHFFGKRRLDISVADNYGDLLARPKGYEALLQNGDGANFGPAVRPIPQKVVALFAGPVQANAQGIAKVPLHLPDFDGQLHLMAVTWQGNATGAGHTHILVRNRLIANLLLPRFLAPNAQAQATVMLQNLELPAGPYQAQVSASGPVRVLDDGNSTTQLTPQVMHLLPVTLQGTGEGMARLTLTVHGPDGYRLVRHWQLVVHSTQVAITKDQTLHLSGGAARVLRPDMRAFLPGSWHSAVTLGNTLPFNPKSYAQALYHGWHCSSLLEVASKTLPLTVLKPPLISANRAAKLQAYVEQILNYQRYDGAFGLWSSEGSAQPWLTAFATEVLLRARQAGATVPQPTLEQALHWLSDEVNNESHSRFDRIYAVYDLSLAGTPPAGAIRLLAQHLNQLSMPLALAQLGSALNTIGERHLALRALHKASEEHTPRMGSWWWKSSDWAAAFGSPLRDAWAVPTIIAQTHLLPNDLEKMRQELPGAGLNPDQLTTQELAWALYADGVLGGQGQEVDVQWGKQVIRQVGPVILPLTGAKTLRNLAKTSLPISIASTGITQTVPPAVAHGVRVSREFFSLTGTPLNPKQIAQNTVFVMVLQGAITDNLPQRALVDVGLPPGWELAGSIAPGKVGHLPWLHDLTTPEATAATDDRYQAAFLLAPKDSTAFEGNGTPNFKTAILLRAVTPGRYALPGVILRNLFHPSVFARTHGRTVVVTAPAA